MTRVGQIEGGQLVATEAERVGAAHDLVPEELVGDGSWRAEAGQEHVEQRGSMPTAAGQTGQRLLRAGGLQRVESRHQLLDRVIPGDGRVVAAPPIAVAFERLRDAIRVVGHLNRRLSARAERAAVDRMHRAAFELLGGQDLHEARLPAADHIGLRVHHPNREPAPRRAQRAHAGLPHRLAGNDVLVRDEADQRVLRAPAARERGAGARYRRELDERSAVHYEADPCNSECRMQNADTAGPREPSRRDAACLVCSVCILNSEFCITPGLRSDR